MGKRIFIDDQEMANKDDLILNTNLLAGIKPQNRTYDRDKQNGLKADYMSNRLLFFPMPVENGEQILVKFTRISSTPLYWGYFFTTVKDFDVPNTVISLTDWLYSSSAKIAVPQNAKYFGVCVGTNNSFTEQTMNQFTQIEVIKQTNVVDYIKANFDALKSKIKGDN